jgi:hypothetical protein
MSVQKLRAVPTVKKMKRFPTLLSCVLSMMVSIQHCHHAHAQEIGFSETFALSADRSVALEQLIPGTEEHYYYTCLHYQATSQLDQVPALVQAWIKRHGRTERCIEIQHRQALLIYAQDHPGALDYLRRELGLNFNHQRQEVSSRPDLPTSLDQNRISWDAFLAQAFAGNSTTDGVEDRGLDVLLSRQLDASRRRSLLSRLTYPDFPGLAELVVADIKVPNHSGFGSLGIHRQLLKNQLDQCLKLMPELKNQQAFVEANLTKLWPDADIDWQQDREARDAYLNRLWNYVQDLAPVHNSLKAHVLYQRLDLARHNGQYPRDLFMEYLKLPRQVFYMRPEYLRDGQRAQYPVNLQQDYSGVTRLPIVGNDEPLVRDYLQHFLLEADDIDAFDEYVQDTYLRRQLAEVKIVNGLGDPQRWYSMLSPAEYQALKERIDLDFALTNAEQYDPADPVYLDLYVKNVSNLIVKVFEINTRNFYEQNLSEVNTDINLDGLVPNWEQILQYETPPLRRIKRHFEFPELNRPGVYVIDFIGNGKSSRALIRKGRLHASWETTPAGQRVTIYDHSNQPLPEATVWLGGRQYTPNDQGMLLIPFSNRPGRVPMILSAGQFSSLDYLQHESEAYTLEGGMYVDREALLRNRQAEVLVRPMLKVNGEPISLKLLTETQLVINSVDLDGVVTTKEIRPFELFEDRESVAEFQVPPRLAQISFVLTGKIKNLSRGQEETLSIAQSYEINQIDRQAGVDAFHLSRVPDGYALELLGKTGEIRTDKPVQVQLKHRDFRSPMNVTLKTDQRGVVILGPMAGIQQLTVTNPDGTTQSWPLLSAQSTPYSVLQGIVGETLSLPYDGAARKPEREELALLSVHGGTFVTDHFNALSIKDGMLQVSGLPAGDYQLLLKRPWRVVTIRLTDGKIEGDVALGESRKLELRHRTPIQIASAKVQNRQLQIQLTNANALTRVHVFATRYQPAFSAMGILGQVRSGEPYWMSRPGWPAVYLEGRSIGEEYQYILDRKYARKYPGNMLERPSLLLNPWAVRSTETGTQEAADGDAFAPSPEPESSSMSGKAGEGAQSGGLSNYPNLDFLVQPTLIEINLVSQDGKIQLELNEDLTKHWITVVAVSPDSTSYTTVIEPAAELRSLDLRLTSKLDSNQHYVQKKQVSPLLGDQEFTIPGASSARVQSYNSLADVFRLMVTLSGNSTLPNFRFVVNWNEKSDQEKRELYSEYACHELHFFLFHKDRPFFENVIQPYLANKRNKTFMDEWLLNANLSKWRQPWNYAQLNAVEKVLLGHRLAEERAFTQRLIAEQYDIAPLSREEFDRLFSVAIKGTSLDVGGTGVVLAELGKAVEFDAEMQNMPMGGGRPGLAGRGGGMGGFGGGGGYGGPAGPGPSAASKPMSGGEARQELRESLDRAAGAKAEKERSLGRRLSQQKRDAANEMYFGYQAEREQLSQLFRQLDKTMEWAENHYYKLPLDQQTASLVNTNRFWRDYANLPADQAFLSPHVAEATHSFTEMMLALAVLDLPWESPEHETSLEDDRFELKAAGPMILFHEQIQPTEAAEDPAPILVNQNFFRQSDRYRYEGEQRFDKFVTDEFLVQTVYGCQVAITNPTSSRQKLDLLLQIPAGSMPVLGGRETRSVPIDLEPFSTRTVEYYFYFPDIGDFAHYPVQVSQDELLVTAADPFTFHVVQELTQIDRESWDYVSQFASNDEVIQFIETHNMLRYDLSRIAFRMKDRVFFEQTIALLTERHLFEPTLWSYGLQHDFVPAIRQYLQFRDDFVQRTGTWIDSELLTIDPELRRIYEHLDYRPLVNARSHRLGAKRKILNNRFFEQYHQLMRILSYQRSLNDDARMAVTYYLLLQDRIEEALATFDEINPNNLETRLQFDLFTAYLDFYRDRPDHARQVAEAYKDYPVDRWRNHFRAILSQVDEIQGAQVAIVDPENRDQQQTAEASKLPSFEFEVEAKQIDLTYQNLSRVVINYYVMDIELLFSRNPFVQEFSGEFSSIRPNLTQTVELPAEGSQHQIELPEDLRSSNLLVEIVGAGKTQSQAYYAHSLKVLVQDDYGQLTVRHEADQRPLPRTYVKVYAQRKDGTVKFYKDGYTDLRGRFDYSSLSTNDLDFVERFSVLILHEEQGAMVKEVSPPKQ